LFQERSLNILVKDFFKKKMISLNFTINSW
jgi:hypothetical protein